MVSASMAADTNVLPNGFMREYEICRLYADARVQRIYGARLESCAN
jgi:alkylation response protein AidB-like acyl-CoA dehydrogenase